MRKSSLICKRLLEFVSYDRCAARPNPKISFIFLSSYPNFQIGPRPSPPAGPSGGSGSWLRPWHACIAVWLELTCGDWDLTSAFLGSGRPSSSSSFSLKGLTRSKNPSLRSSASQLLRLFASEITPLQVPPLHPPTPTPPEGPLSVPPTSLDHIEMGLMLLSNITVCRASLPASSSQNTSRPEPLEASLTLV